MSGVILLYHRVGAATSDPWALAVTPERFHDQMAAVRRDFRPVPLGQILAGSPPGDLQVAVTFDDGYAETAAIAERVLEAFDIPATCFVPSGALDSTGEFWWDELERLLLGAGDLPGHLSLETGAGVFDRRLGTAASLTPEEVAHARGWCAWQTPAPTARHALYAELWRLCHRLGPDERSALIGRLRAWAGDDGTAREGYRRLSTAELEALCRSGLIEIGGHTVTHPALSTLSAAAQADEVQSDRATLQRLTGQAVESFAYPFGKPTDYTPSTVEIVRAAGYRAACANVPGPVSPGAAPFELPRLFVADCDGATLAAQVNALLGEAVEP